MDVENLVNDLDLFCTCVVICPSCGKEHISGHEDTCACDHCALVAQTKIHLGKNG